MTAADERLKTASDNYMNNKFTCSQAVFSAFAEEMGLAPQTAYRLMEGFGGGFGAKQEVCGAFSAACAVISYHYSTGSMDGKSKGLTYKAVRRAAELFEKKYGSIRCIEVLHGEPPRPFKCGMKVKDAVLIAQQLLDEKNSNL